MKIIKYIVFIFLFILLLRYKISICRQSEITNAVQKAGGYSARELPTKKKIPRFAFQKRKISAIRAFSSTE